MASGFDLVIFDCDGVVVDSEVLACRCLAEVLTRHGLPTGLDEVFDRFLGRSSKAVDEHYRACTGRALPESFRGEFQDCLAEVFRTSLQPVPEIRAVLEAMDGPYCLASSSDDARIRTTLAAAGVTGYFGERVFSAAMVERGKPAPDLFLHAAREMGADPARTLVVEDTVPGVLAGKAAGMTVWGFIGGSHCAGRNIGEKLAAAGADRVFDAMAKFAAA